MTTPWSTDVELIDAEHLRVCLMLTTDPGPVREFKPFIDIDLDEAHAVELIGKLSLGLSAMRRTREAVAIAGVDADDERTHFATDWMGNGTSRVGEAQACAFAKTHGGRVYGPHPWWKFWRRAA